MQFLGISSSIVMISFLSAFAIISHDIINKEGSETNNPWVFNVPQAFFYIPVKTEKNLALWAQDSIEFPRYCPAGYSRTSRRTGKDSFSSIKRLPGHLNIGNYLAIIGNNSHTMNPEMFIAKIGSRSKLGLFEKNIIKKRARATDGIVATIPLSSYYTQAGGIDMSGKYLVIPLSKKECSSIIFYDMKNPEQPLLLPTSITRNDSNALAAALTQLIDGRFLLAIATDGPEGTNKGFDFYFSISTNINDGFDAKSLIHIDKKSFFNYSNPKKCTYKTINFVNDYNGSLYLIATFNSPTENPFNIGEDFVHFFEIQLRTVTQDVINRAQKIDPTCITASLTAGSKKPYVWFLQEKHMFCRHNYCNFNISASLYIPDQQHLYIYSLPQWLTEDGKSLYFAQYGSIQKTYPR